MRLGFTTGLIFFALPALGFAQTPPPSVVTLPLSTMTQIYNYLNTRPRGEVNSFATAFEVCLQMQLPDKDGKVEDKGYCPPVTQALAAIQKQIADAKAEAKTPESPSDKK